jgi:hypothetical protein
VYSLGRKLCTLVAGFCVLLWLKSVQFSLPSTAFAKSDNFIKTHIRQHRKNHSPQGELIRFTQLYNQFAQNEDSINVVPNSF